MRKLFILICSSVVLLVLASSCSVEENLSDSPDSTVEFGGEFINKLYNVEDLSLDYDNISPESLIDYQQKFSSYLTEKEFENLAVKRLLLMPQEAASKQNSTIAVRDLEFEQYERDQADDDSLDFNHSFTLLFTDLDGNKEVEVDINGQMTIIETENGLKIDRYYDSQIPVDMLFP